jgi:hypothetical protein
MSVAREHRIPQGMNRVHSMQIGASPTRAQGMRRRRRRVKLADVGLVGITQTVPGRGPEFGEPTGNAMQAALATVFGLPLTAVPHFAGMDSDGGGLVGCHEHLARGTLRRGFN